MRNKVLAAAVLAALTITVAACGGGSGVTADSVASLVKNEVAAQIEVTPGASVGSVGCVTVREEREYECVAELEDENGSYEAYIEVACDSEQCAWREIQTYAK